MTDKRKKRIKELAAEKGISHRAAANIMAKEAHEQRKAQANATFPAGPPNGAATPTEKT